MRVVVILLLMLLALPPAADAAGARRFDVTKPVRGQYERTSRQTTVRPPLLPRSPGSGVLQSYVNGALGISLTHPSDWEAEESNNAFWLELSDDEQALISERASAMLVTVYDIPYKRDYTPKEIDKRYRSNVSLNSVGLSWSWFMKSYRLLGSTGATLFGHPGRRFEYLGFVGPEQYRVSHILMSFNEKLYEVRYRSAPETFEKDLPAFEEMLETLSLAEPTPPLTDAQDRRRKRASARIKR